MYKIIWYAGKDILVDGGICLLKIQKQHILLLADSNQHNYFFSMIRLQYTYFFSHVLSVSRSKEFSYSYLLVTCSRLRFPSNYISAHQNIFLLPLLLPSRYPCKLNQQLDRLFGPSESKKKIQQTDTSGFKDSVSHSFKVQFKNPKNKKNKKKTRAQHIY